MGKKDKKFDAPQDQAATQAPAGDDSSAPGEAKTPLIPRNPSLYLQDEAGVQFKFDRRDLPKKALVQGEISIDGVATKFQVTSNKGWTLDDKVIDYIWVTLPSAPIAEGAEAPKPVTGYITLDYLVPAASFQGKVFTTGAGEANRKNPARVPKSEESEVHRKAAAAATLAAKKAATEAGAASQAAADAPATV